MSTRVQDIVIVGGGTAGWLTASLLAARHSTDGPDGLRITLIESPDIPIIGVGEGTWPTLRGTLGRIGLSEPDFLRACDASFKQGSRFDGWVTGASGDSYLHPFDAPVSLAADDLVRLWRTEFAGQSFADAVSAQPAVCAAGLAPRQARMPDYAAALNYAYHLDATKFGRVLAEHATSRLGVRHLRDHVTGVSSDGADGIASVATRENGEIAGDLFVDCTGHRALLIGQQLETPFIDRSDILFNDRAIAAQVPVDPDREPVASQTVSTAHDHGWIWDIGLPSRRGVGCVYASSHCDADAATAALEAYIGRTRPEGRTDDITMRELAFQSGHRAEFWRGNCVAIGLSAGFLEPLEASAIVLVELSARRLADHLPASRDTIPAQARRFNEIFRYRWDRIVDFLKLHYVLSRRDQPYWQAHRDPASWPDELAERLAVWKSQPPSPDDFDHAEEIFPAASYQYILYGMGFETTGHPSLQPRNDAEIIKQMQALNQRRRALMAALPTNRALLDALPAAAVSGIAQAGGH